MSFYDYMNNAAMAIVALLIVLFVIIIVIDSKSSRVFVQRKMKPRQPRVRLELMYPSAVNKRLLHMPVKDIFHAQEVVDTLELPIASVGYRRSADGKSITLYSLDDSRVLRRVSEVV